jgi:ABC-2 type transport system permease protein
MRRFAALLKKEIKELLTPQMILPMALGIAMFVLLGNIMGSETKKISQTQNIAVLDMDRSPMSQSVVDILKQYNFNVTSYSDSSIDEVINKAKESNIPVVMSIPEGFEEGINRLQPQEIETYSIIRNFSVMGSISSHAANAALEAINEYVSDQYIMNLASVTSPQDLKNPVMPRDFVIIGERSANAKPGDISGFIISQSIFIPIVMFIVIMFSAQMIAVTIASEKENKTLETLLSTPVSRISLVSAKMLAAGLVSLLMAAAYMFGFRYYMKGLTGGAIDMPSGAGLPEAINELGLSISTPGFILLGLSLFLCILIALAISLILGAFAEDIRKVQGLISPIILLITIPYIITMFVDLNTASPVIKILVYAIPFSHPFLATPNLFLRRYDIVIYGIIYEAILFLIFVFIAARIFSTDKVLTMKLNFRKRRSADNQ